MAKSGITGAIERSQQSVSRYESAEKTPLKSNKFSSNDYYGICRINLKISGRSKINILGSKRDNEEFLKTLSFVLLSEINDSTLLEHRGKNCFEDTFRNIIHVERRRILKETVNRPISSCEMFMQTIPFLGRDRQTLPQEVQ